jgi:prepilin-type N-terminal cleavage/methylation domain-containing protein
MSNRSGFTLIELIVALMIAGFLSALAIPSFISNIQEGAARTAQNNLISISSAEKNFYLANAYYCTASTQNTTCANTLAHLNTGLSLNIADTHFTYACTDPNSATDSNNGSSFSCTATNTANTSFTLTVTNNSIVLPGGTNCTTANTTACNPSCTDVANPGYCPN